MIVDVAVALIRRHGDEYLIAKRAHNGDLPGYWEFIGGKVEGDESPNEAVVREAREEIGAVILIHEDMDPFIFRYPHGTFKIFPFVCELLSRNDEICVDLDIHSEMRWVHLLDTGSEYDCKFAGADTVIIQMLRRHYVINENFIRGIIEGYPN